MSGNPQPKWGDPKKVVTQTCKTKGVLALAAEEFEVGHTYLVAVWEPSGEQRVGTDEPAEK
jgi:hypothetical protein